MFREILESKLTKKKVDKMINSFAKDNRSNGEDAIDSYSAAEIFVDDEPEVTKWLESNGFDALDYVSSRMG